MLIVTNGMETRCRGDSLEEWLERLVLVWKAGLWQSVCVGLDVKESTGGWKRMGMEGKRRWANEMHWMFPPYLNSSFKCSSMHCKNQSPSPAQGGSETDPQQAHSLQPDQQKTSSEYRSSLINNPWKSRVPHHLKILTGCIHIPER